MSDNTGASLKKWISDNNILFVTNSSMKPGGIFLSSIRTYIDKIPIHNFTVYPGIVSDKPFYGIDVFFQMTKDIYTDPRYNKFDYVIYIDEDAFIVNFEKLIDEFMLFMKNDDYCLGGPQDGGVFCHRNHSSIMINTFISFWNVKLLRKSGKFKDFINIAKKITAYPKTSMKLFIEMLSSDGNLDKFMKNTANDVIKRTTEFRKNTYGLIPSGDTPYCDTVRNDEMNPVERNQIPYSYSFSEKENFEPYYLIEQCYILMTHKPIYYMFSTDYYDNDDVDKFSGLTSAVYTDEDAHELIAVHTWFSRLYSKFPSNNIMLMHTNRINKIIIKYGKI
jgi:hypothetical protein